MKCPTCESCEYAQYSGATEIMRKCERHNKKVKQTNEEWLEQASTEEKATVIYGIAMYDTLYDRIHNAFVLNPCEDDSAGINEVMKWLKEKHE